MCSYGVVRSTTPSPTAQNSNEVLAPAASGSTHSCQETSVSDCSSLCAIFPCALSLITAELDFSAEPYTTGQKPSVSDHCHSPPSLVIHMEWCIAPRRSWPPRLAATHVSSAERLRERRRSQLFHIYPGPRGERQHSYPVQKGYVSGAALSYFLSVSVSGPLLITMLTHFRTFQSLFEVNKNQILAPAASGNTLFQLGLLRERPLSLSAILLHSSSHVSVEWSWKDVMAIISRLPEVSAPAASGNTLLRSGHARERALSLSVHLCDGAVSFLIRPFQSVQLMSCDNICGIHEFCQQLMPAILVCRHHVFDMNSK
ncbi:hypothetical protein Hypma_001278 [Hypsizygus marmoreus]|uniref:Uncharacterized protein n=1 Tax=Hypsizygus marmoreus TaxID=39966 RepID=A0A369JFM8_HYPMA|nr:hypothetical protein Hypma_001278 [Hypsizygus marmoreus]